MLLTCATNHLVPVCALLFVCIHPITRPAHAFLFKTVRVVERLAIGILAAAHLFTVDFVLCLAVSHFASTLGASTKCIVATLLVATASVTYLDSFDAFLSAVRYRVSHE